MHEIGKRMNLLKKKNFSYKKPGDHWRYEKKSYFRTMKEESINNVTGVTCNKALKTA